jgi:hypothetical protein
MIDPLEKPDGLNWNPAAVELPEVPLLPPGEDAMSETIAAVLPALTAPLATSVAALSAKENMFRGKLGTAESVYQNADDSGQQSMGQLAGMLGQVGQLGQQAGAPAQAASGLSEQTGMFGSLMQQAMQGAQGGHGAGGAGGAAHSAGSAPAAGQLQQPRVDAAGTQEQQADRAHEPQRDDRAPLSSPETDDRAMAGPSTAEDSRPGPAPVTPPEHPHPSGDGELARRM